MAGEVKRQSERNEKFFKSSPGARTRSGVDYFTGTRVWRIELTLEQKTRQWKFPLSRSMRKSLKNSSLCGIRSAFGSPHLSFFPGKLLIFRQNIKWCWRGKRWKLSHDSWHFYTQQNILKLNFLIVSIRNHISKPRAWIAELLTDKKTLNLRG